MPAPEPLLRLDRVSKSFGGVTALKDVSLSVPRSEICGIIGPNGAGKSTLFGTIAGSVIPTSGSIVYMGRNVGALPMYRRTRLGIARTFQLAHTFDSMSVAENVLVGAENHAHLNLLEAMTHLGGFRARQAEAERRASEAMEVAGVAEIARLPGAQLTFGQQRLVAAARALAARPQLLLLDEPAAGLSSGDIEILCAAVLRAREAGATVLIVEHNMDVIMRLCDHVVVMHLGQKIGDGTPEEVRQSESVVEAYLGA